MFIERFHIHGNENDKNITRNLPVIMPYLRHIVEPTYIERCIGVSLVSLKVKVRIIYVISFFV